MIKVSEIFPATPVGVFNFRALVTEAAYRTAENRSDAVAFRALLPRYGKEFQFIIAVDDRLDYAAAAAAAHLGSSAFENLIPLALDSGLMRFCEPKSRTHPNGKVTSLSFDDICLDRKIHVIAAEPLYFISLTDEVWQ